MCYHTEREMQIKLDLSKSMFSDTMPTSSTTDPFKAGRLTRPPSECHWCDSTWGQIRALTLKTDALRLRHRGGNCVCTSRRIMSWTVQTSGSAYSHRALLSWLYLESLFGTSSSKYVIYVNRFVISFCVTWLTEKEKKKKRRRVYAQMIRSFVLPQVVCTHLHCI